MSILHSYKGLNRSLEDVVISRNPVPGSPGLGDSLYPNFGNGGYDVQHYDINLDISDVLTSTLVGTTTIEAIATQSLSSFNLDFIGFDIDGITVNGQPASFSRDGQELTITPAKPLTNRRKFTVEVIYSGSPEPITSVAIPVPTGWVIFGGGSFVLSEPDGAANYYPVNDHPLDKASYTFQVKLDEEFEVAANGVLEQKIDNDDNTTTYVFEARDPMASYLTTVNITGGFNIETDMSATGVPIRNYFAEGIPSAKLQLFDLQPEMVDFYSSIFGPYPFELYGAVVMDTDTGTALETQTLSIFGLGQLESPTLEETIAHETAHQWLGNDVSLSDWSDIWLNESFATYSQGLWIEYSRGAEALDQWVTEVYDFVEDYFEFFVPPGEPLADDLFNPGVYEWGALGLHALRLEVGDITFFDIISTYYDTYKGGNVFTEDLIAVAEKVSKLQLGSFFDRWIYNDYLAPIPELGLAFDGHIVGDDNDNVLNATSFTGDVIFAAGGNDTVTGELGNDVIFGEFGNDMLQGKLGNDTIYGGADRDQIIGEGGNDELYGDEGNDVIWGNEGNDLLQGDLGNDALYGDTGQDTFVIEIGAGIDNIKDFEIGTDLIGLTGGLAFSDLIKTQRGNNTWLRSERQVLAILSDVDSNLLTENSFTNLSSSEVI